MPGMPTRHQAAVDTRRDASLSFAPLDRPVERAQPSTAIHDAPTSDRVAISRRPQRRPRLVVEGVRSGLAALGSTGGDLGTMSEYPIQISKVQAPPLREETLARDRLLEWLSVKVHRRAVLLIAEAGYGKTTLLADFSRRTRLRVLWFRLDRGDRDWVGFIAYLVAAVRVHVPDFAPSTAALLRETATASPPLDTVLDTFLRELSGLPNDATAFVFDDVHLVDDSPDVRHILRELIARGPRADVVRLRQPARAAGPACPAARSRGGCRAPDRRSPVQRPRDRAPVSRDLRDAPRARRPCRAPAPHRGLGGVAPARTSGPPRPRPGPGAGIHLLAQRRRGAPVRVPRGGGRRRAPGRPPAVPHAYVTARDGRSRARAGRG